jgi:integrase
MPVAKGRRTGTWRVTVWATGRQHEEIFEGPRGEALEHEARMRLSLVGSGRLTQRIAPRFFEFCAAVYEPHARVHLAASTWNVRSYQMATLVGFFGAFRLTELSTALVDAYKTERRKLVGPTTVNNELRVLGAMLRFAKDERGLPVADVRLKKLASPRGRVHAWSADEVARLLDAAERTDRSFLPLVLFLLYTGVRKGEAIAAEWSWIDARCRILSIPATSAWRPKSGRAREVSLNDELRPVLERLPRDTLWLFPNAHANAYACFPNERFRALVVAAKLEGGPHTCRHTFASHALAGGLSLHDLAGVLGHSSTRVTEVYAHLLPGHLERSRNAVSFAAPSSELARVAS